ncbi:MAG: hypothetical protein IT304_08175 [Dehalococcoidia bacterium]|nr:hypothetical protein [Dehalococcoidia bacterium]
MAFTAAEVEELIEALQREPQLRDRLRNAILTDDFLALPGIVRQLGERIERLTERMGLAAEACVGGPSVVAEAAAHAAELGVAVVVDQAEEAA